MTNRASSSVEAGEASLALGELLGDCPAPLDVREADEAWFTSTTICMLPITRFNFQPVGNGQVGPIYRRLLEAWSEEVGVDIAAQARDYAEMMDTWNP